VPSNVEIDGGGGACGRIIGKPVVSSTFVLNNCFGSNTSLSHEPVLVEGDPGLVAGAAILLPANDLRPSRDADDVENSGTPISTIEATSVPKRIIE
jgi:hypothetical protein